STLSGFILSNGNSLDSLTSWNNLSSDSKAGETIAVIKKDGEIIKTINLSNMNNREIIKISGQYAATIVAEHNKICFFDSNCIDEICIKTGWLSKAGDLAVCLPNKTIIKLQQK
ncbi:MAG: NusG domain II-containing protein, partial [Ruminiclostridium sp.]